MTPRRTILLLLAAAGAALASAAQGAALDAVAKRDHDAILGMAGDFKVRFDMRETVSFVPGYKLLDPKVSGGTEAVRMIEDRGDFISLQHLLVAKDGDKTIVVKHWRQDWTWQPATVLTYERAGHWVVTPVPAAQRKGAWSQTVWQTDDSPRYGGVGHWAHDNGVDRWTSDTSLRPLARRDATRHPPYSWYVGQNRHALTPVGWVHEQDNAKVGVVDGKLVTFAHEVVLNSYVRAENLPVQPADAYWTATKDYWAAVRHAWADATQARGGLAVREEPEYGSVTGERLMDLADDIQAGKTATPAAIGKARAIIAEETARP